MIHEPSVRKQPTRKILSVLLGKKHIPLALRSITNWQSMSHVPFCLRIYGDASFDAEDLHTLRAGLGEIEFLSREESTSVTESILRSRYPSCWKYRNMHFWGTKLFDLALNSKESLHYMDSDILFSTTCDFGEFWNLEVNPFVFMKDATNAYSFDWKGLLELKFRHLPKRIPAIEKVNAGVLAIDLRYFDLDYLEFLFSSPIYRKILNGFFDFYEQTTFSLLGAKYGAGLMSPVDMILANGEVYKSSDFPKYIGVHFAGPCRYMMEAAFEQLSDLKPTEAPKIIRTIPATEYPLTGIIKRSLLKTPRKVARLLGLMRNSN